MDILQGPIQSLDRAFYIIDIIANSQEPLSLKEITDLSKLPKPTVYRILSSLELWGYVDQDGKKGYKLGTKFMFLGSKVQDDLEIREIARPFLKRLNEETKETVFLGIMDKGRSLYVDKLDSHHSVRLFSKVGTRNFLHSTSLGKCLLSGLDDGAVIKVLEKYGMPKITGNTITNPTEMLKQLKFVREQGYAYDEMENEEGVRCIAAPVKDHRGRVIAAVSISGPAQRLTKEMIEKNLKHKLLKTTLDISEALGYKG